jgi:hypothetical protein
MKQKSAGKKGQFSIISALLIAIIMVSAVIMTYAAIRNLPFQESPKVLSSVDEMNLSLKQLLEFAVGYYGSVLQVTGNVTYAKNLTSSYLQSGFGYIAHSHPQWNPSFMINYSDFSTLWYEPLSYSMGNLSVKYSLSGLGLYQITYKASSLLKVEILDTLAGQSRVRVTREDETPDLSLTRENFFFYNYSESTWHLISPSADPVVFTNGTYILQIPSGVAQDSYLIKVSDAKGVMATAFFSNSRKPQYTYTFTYPSPWNSTIYPSLTKDTIVVEALQNGTMRWLGQNLQLTTTGKPILPLPVRALHINQTINGISREVPFQVEDWGSGFQVPLGLTSNASLFGDRQMIVFLVNHNVQKVTLWWNGLDTTKQTPYAWTCRYFNGDNPSQRRLTNGILTITISSDYETITSSVAGGSITSTASFMRINNQNPTYGAGPSYVIYKGIVRDIVQQEAEWSNGITNCPNVYSQMYLTLPANATYYTYALRLLFINSAQSRTITDLSAIQLSVSGGSQRTENGTSSGYPISSNVAGLFYNFTSPSFQTGWAHHWSEFISGNSGAGIMFTDSANQKLYCFDTAGQKTGALNVISSGRTIEVNPIARSQYPASFLTPLDVTWHGAVVTFANEPTNTIYPTSGNIGLWVMVENPPRISTVSPTNASITVTSSPSGSGYVKVDGNPVTTPYTITWDIGSTHALEAISPVNTTDTRYVWAGWSDGGAKNHTYTVPALDATISANWQTQYQVTFNYQVSGGGAGYSAPSVTYYQSGSPLSVTAGPSATVWVDSGSTYTYTNPLSGSGANERWQTNQASGTISSQGTINPTYYHQYKITVTASPGGAIGGTFSVTYTQFGTVNTNQPQTTTWNSWADASTTATVSSPQSPYNGYAFSSYTNNPATMNSAQTITLNYQLRPPPALDGYASTNTVTSNTMTITLTTTQPNDVLYLSWVGNGGRRITGVSSSGTSAWTRRAYIAADGTHYVETWYATRATAGTTTITITLTSDSSTNCAAVAFGISGADTASPFDGNARTATGNSASASVSVTTSSANEFIIGALGLENTNSLTTGSGFTLIRTQTVGTSRQTSDEYMTAATAGTYTARYTWTGSDYWGIIAEAVKQAP